MLNAFVLASVMGQASINLVQPILIIEKSTINFGDVQNYPNSTCTLSLFERQGSGCLASEWRSGTFHLSGLANKRVTIELVALKHEKYSFTPFLSNGLQSQTYDLKTGELDIDIGAELTLNTLLESGIYNINYLIEVVYE
ncbi:hypothetical protein FM038_011075 [Shewanella eurypsychrophilus]|uniref:DUF4402 domain-containing protein n=1 Tax=Shewanella eurypsychrophilus TaxID=2593656 RepID=A0ABX6V7G6_9GAMM|nr:MULTISPECIES: hypothetical protein [Shewanella]QFU22650.1 hypothetical protein FS418_12655 [Shewanella sp. YLB-09]QPG57939.1 hypothetical protein FM038_011075 [Shewanella eurypsychrophilus]